MKTSGLRHRFGTIWREYQVGDPRKRPHIRGRKPAKVQRKQRRFWAHVAQGLKP